MKLNIKTIICSQSLHLIALKLNTLLKVSSLPHSISIYPFFSPWKHKKTRGFLMLSELMESEHCSKMDQLHLGHILALQIMSWANITQGDNFHRMQLSCCIWVYRFRYDWKFGLKWFNEYCKHSIIGNPIFRLSLLFERFLWHDENYLTSSHKWLPITRTSTWPPKLQQSSNAQINL